MKTFIFTYDRFDAIATSIYLKDHPHYVLCHTEDSAEKFRKAGRIHGELIATGQPKGLSNNRNYALDMMADGEWACFWVDDLQSVSVLPEQRKYGEDLNIDSSNQPMFRELFKTDCPAEKFFEVCKETIELAEKKGFALCGFSLTDNPLFRSKHYSYWSLADGRCWLIKKTKLRFDTKVQLIDDTCFTALNLKEFGGVVVNNWLLPKCERYTAGAFGTIKERMEQKKSECKYLVDTYPDFICYGEKVGWEEGSHVKIRQKKMNKDQVSLF